MTLQDDSIAKIKFSRMLLEWIIRDYPDDPRIDEPKRQLKIINEEISRRENEKPQDLVVGLKTLKIKGNTRR
jgi:hypothetical protein